MRNGRMGDTPSLTIDLIPVESAAGAPEEQATSGMLVMEANGRRLTEGATDTDELKAGPLVSGFHVAEWFALNWWRLFWETSPGERRIEWDFAHCMATVGEGYVWPNITVSSDGYRSQVASTPTVDRTSGLYRYLGSARVEWVPSFMLEESVDRFIALVLDRLEISEIHDTNLHSLWQDVKQARQSPDDRRFRRIEARLGHDPDQGDADQIATALRESERLGWQAVDELAAEAGSRGIQLPTAETLHGVSAEAGFSTQPNDAVQLRGTDGRRWQSKHADLGRRRAWRVGVEMARALRKQERLNGEVLDNSRLTDLAATQPATIEDRRGNSSFSFLLHDNRTGSARVVLRSKLRTGRRFDLARLIGDRIFLADPEPLAPATTASTYRQQLQRAFAVELLCPFAALEDMLEGDTSDDACTDAAAAFDVSPLAVRWQLENNQSKADYTADHEQRQLLREQREDLMREQRDDLMRDVRG